MVSRTGKLQRLLENLRREQQDMVRSAVDLQDLKDRMRTVGMLASWLVESHQNEVNQYNIYTCDIYIYVRIHIMYF